MLVELQIEIIRTRIEEEMMKWPAPSSDDQTEIHIASDTPSSSSNCTRTDDNIITINPPTSTTTPSTSFVIGKKLVGELRTIACPSCSHHIPLHHQGGIVNDLPGMPAGVKFDPTDFEVLEHLEAKAKSDNRKLHPLIDEFIPTLEGDNGICYTHPENLPGVSKDGQMRHFFHRPSKAYTTGTRKRRKVHSHEDDGSGSSGETRWHKTGKTRAVVANGIVKGFKKILVLYTNYGRQKKPEKTNWVMHQYHLGHSEEEKEGELVLSKVFFQTQPRHSVMTFKEPVVLQNPKQQQQQQQQQLLVGSSSTHNSGIVEYYHQQPRFISFDQCVSQESNVVPQMNQNLGVHLGDHNDGSYSVDLDGRNKKKEKLEADRK